MAEHRYGGPWTQIKHDALERYLAFYTSALRFQPFDLWYVDAFAGSGDRIVEGTAGGLFEGIASHPAEIRLDGSATIALNVSPPFQRLVFIENNPSRHEALLRLQAAHPERAIECYRDDANVLVRAICKGNRWRAPRAAGRSARAVLFLDPYGMQVEWQTLQSIRETRSVDLLYLFPIGGILRQAALDLSKVDPHKDAAITRIYGTSRWREEWYSESRQGDLLKAAPTILRHATNQQIEAGFKARLETLFPYVSDPLPLLTSRGAKLYSLFLAASNDSPRALALIKKVVAHVMRTPPPASPR